MGKHTSSKHLAASGRAAASRGAAGSESRRAAVEEQPWRASSDQKKGRPVLVIVIVIVAIVLVLLLAAYLIFGYLYSKLNYRAAMSESEKAEAIATVVLDEEPEEEELFNTINLPEEELPVISEEEVVDIQDIIRAQLEASGGSLIADEEVVNILFIGTDGRSRNERARSDVMLLISANKNTHKIVVTSFMRDIYTYIPDYGYNRLNAPNAIAGPEYLIETLEADFGVDIGNYASVNFYDFADIIDTLGGVDISLTNAEVDFINNVAYYGEQMALGVGSGASFLDYSADGMYHLNGTQALAHCRNRSSAGSDYDRTERQRTVLTLLIQKAKSLPLTDLYELLNKVLPLVTTDLTRADCLSLLLSSPDYLSYEVETLRIPAVDYSGAMIDGMSVITIDFASNAEVLQDAIYN